MVTEKAVPDRRQELRTLHRKLRAEMSAGEVQEKSRQICGKVLASDWYKGCSVLCAYYPLGQEVDCRPVVDQALTDGKCVALPRTEERAVMEFYRIFSLEQVKEGRFHVMEPFSGCPLVRTAEALVLVPGVAFDTQGMRYGYGKGYYDRYFARFPGLLRAALAYENQMESKLDAQTTDVRMGRIYTEQTVYFVEKSDPGVC